MPQDRADKPNVNIPRARRDPSSSNPPKPQNTADLLAPYEPPITLGSCILNKPEAARIVQKAISYFEGQRYYLGAWCVMPNHVHALLLVADEHDLSDILHSWKSYTSKEINRLIGRQGTLWERESFDHLIRSPDALEDCIRYTELNPVVAGLCSRPEDWPYSSCGTGFRPAREFRFVDPRETPFVPIADRGELPHLYKEVGVYFVSFRLFDAVAVGAR